MGRFESNIIKKREFAWGRITFGNKYCIIVETPFCTTIFHRYGAPQGYYSKCWRLFRQELLRRNLDSLYDVYRYANRFDVTHYTKSAGANFRNDEKMKLREEK